MKKDIQGFLQELTVLTNKYGIQIAACKCCNSPFLIEVSRDIDGISILKDNLQFDRVSKIYSVENVSEENYYQYDGEMYNGNGKKLHINEDEE